MKIGFRGGFDELEGWNICNLRVEDGDVGCSGRAMVIEGAAEVEAVLLAESRDLKALERKRNLLVTALAGVYPFKATRLLASASVSSNRNAVYISLNLRLLRGFVAYAATFKGVLAYSTWEEANNKVDVDLGLTYRFKPFVAFRMAVLLISIIYATALLTVGISMAAITLYTNRYLARFALLAANASLFTAVAEIQTGLGTRSLMGELKVAAWVFIALTVLQLTYALARN